MSIDNLESLTFTGITDSSFPILNLSKSSVPRGFKALFGISPVINLLIEI